MNKTKYMIYGVQFTISLIGCYLIGDVKIIFGVVMFMWANNFNFVKKESIDK